ncbi:preprotein translocase subunit SecG [Thermomicrobium sp. CFH 73360]|uniref:preprotein translocase subunit SecG n=1 Tax=Thermomicrobium sp. CFH 73360 TaxID=2951987 RepID=UPI0020778189|nr:preprotein translocase subunit SecG [Thermomicrobium sp. CFH 73360]MCM8746678.1 preprotein translocase subunit SecG [Thermomicrobium sp. CFH 73360]
MEAAFYIAIILVSLLLMMVILLQTKASGFSGAFGGDTSAIYRTRRGLERTLFQLTIGVAIVFVVLSIIGQWLL